MSTRLVHAVLWMFLILVPPLRALLVALALLLWPSIEPFRTLSEIHATWVPFVALLVVLLPLTYWALRHLLHGWLDARPQLRRTGSGERAMKPVAIALTIGWVLALALLGALDLPLVLVAGITLYGLGAPTVGEKPGESVLPLPEPAPLPEFEPEEGAPGAGGEVLDRKFPWLYNTEPYRKAGVTHRFQIDLPIPKADYERARAQDHTVTHAGDFVAFANAQVHHAVVGRVARELRAISEREGYDRLAEIHLVMAFTLSMPYQEDEEEYGGEYPKYPVEMLADQRGDCEDFSILCGAILRRLGHDVALILMDLPHLGHGHAALGVVPPQEIPGAVVHDTSTGKRYFYCEVTPPPETTTAETTEVQWYLGMDYPEGASNLQPFPIQA